MITKLIGREPDCDLVIENVGAIQARLELTDAGHVYLVDAGSDINTCLNRNEQWIRIHKIRLCVADRIRFGECELPLTQLISAFGKRVDVRLGDENFSLRRQQAARSGQNGNAGSAAKTQRPRRNPLTGKIEQSQH